MVAAHPDTPRIVLRINRRKQQVATVIVQPEAPKISNNASPHSHSFNMPTPSLSTFLQPSSSLPDSLDDDVPPTKRRRLQKPPTKTYASSSRKVARNTLISESSTPDCSQVLTPPEEINSIGDEAQEALSTKQAARENSSVQQPIKGNSEPVVAPVEQQQQQQQSETGRTLRSKDIPKIYEIIPRDYPKYPIRFDEPILVINGPFAPAPRTRNFRKRSADETTQQEDCDWEYLQPLENTCIEVEETPKEASEPITRFDWSSVGKFAESSSDPLANTVYTKSHKKWEKMEKEAVAAGNRKTEGDIEYLRGELPKLQGSRWKDVLKLPRSCSSEELQAAEEERIRLVEVIKSKVRLSDAYAVRFKELVKFESRRRNHSHRASTENTVSPPPAPPPPQPQKSTKKQPASVLEVEEASSEQGKKRRPGELTKEKPTAAPSRTKVAKKRMTPPPKKPSLNTENRQNEASPIFDSFERDPIRREAIRKKFRTSSRHARPFGQPISQNLSLLFETPNEYTLPHDVVEGGQRYRKLLP